MSLWAWDRRDKVLKEERSFQLELQRYLQCTVDLCDELGGLDVMLSHDIEPRQ
jgi:hypothetical protein